jgi:hypothetical protein
MIKNNLPESLSASMEGTIEIGLSHRTLHIFKFEAVFTPKKNIRKKKL